jgi:hypothetical protein
MAGKYSDEINDTVDQIASLVVVSETEGEKQHMPNPTKSYTFGFTAGEILIVIKD